jgi:hypothetical protein
MPEKRGTEESNLALRFWRPPGLLLQDNAGDAMQRPEASGVDLPGTVPARDSGMTYFDTQTAVENGLDVDRPVVAFARLSTKQQVHSAPTIL